MKQTCAQWRTLLTTMLCIAVVACATDAGDRRMPREAVLESRASVPPMDRTVDQRLLPQVDALLQQLIAEERALVLDGQPVFNGRDKFLPGKIAVGMAHVIQRLPQDDPRLPKYLQGFRRMSALTLQDENREWGIFYYLTALEMLREAGLLDHAVAPETLAVLKQRLDWRTFVREQDLTLIDLPNNYYGVAYGVAQLRSALGWDEQVHAQKLLDKTLAHYRTYSESGFADETEGDGRYDRYSVLLIAEIAHRFIEAGKPPPDDVKDWLRASAKLMLLRAGPDGDGFEYGRSIGAYGETAVVEVLTAAAVVGVLTKEETDAAYAVCARIAQRYMDVWVDARTGSVNLWDGGRRTDTYRGKHRILGENLSLARQFFYTSDLWRGLGYTGISPSVDLAAWRRHQPTAVFTLFSAKSPQRGLFTVIDGARLFGLPFINGGAGQHMHSPYFPLPFSPGLISGIADSTKPQLTPRLRLGDGSVLQPLAYYSDLHGMRLGKEYRVAAKLLAMDRMGENAPKADHRIRGDTSYVFAPGSVERQDVYVLSPDVDEIGIEMEFANYGRVRALERDGDAWVAEFDDPVLRRFRVQGFDHCSAMHDPPAEYATPTGAFASVVRCATPSKALSGASRSTIRLGWRIEYGLEE
jgi:hypothetical protein